MLPVACGRAGARRCMRCGASNSSATATAVGRALRVPVPCLRWPLRAPPSACCVSALTWRAARRVHLMTSTSSCCTPWQSMFFCAQTSIRFFNAWDRHLRRQSPCCACRRDACSGRGMVEPRNTQAQCSCLSHVQVKRSCVTMVPHRVPGIAAAHAASPPAADVARMRAAGGEWSSRETQAQRSCLSHVRVKRSCVTMVTHRVPGIATARAAGGLAPQVPVPQGPRRPLMGFKV